MNEKLSPPLPKSVLVVVAHPDDIEFNFAGTAAKWAREGSEIYFVVCTSGESGSHDLEMPPERLMPIRQAEENAAAKILGVKKVIFLNYHDGSMENTLPLRRDITRIIRQFRPDALISWDPTCRYFSSGKFNHPDHIVVGEACLSSLMPSCDSPFIFPELMKQGYEPFKVHDVYLFKSLEPNMCVDITETIDIKIKAIQCHKSQFGDWKEIQDDVRSLAKYDGEIQGMLYAETFRYFHL